MDAEIIVKFRFLNATDEQDLAESGKTFEEMVRCLIDEEGLLGLVESDWEIQSVRELA